MSLHVVFGLSLALLGASAGRHGYGHLARGVNNRNISQDLMISLERTECFGGRPVYKLCPTDHPSAFTSIRINGKSKTINHYLGCLEPKVPKGLTELENKIDEIVNTAQWLPDKKER